MHILPLIAEPGGVGVDAGVGRSVALLGFVGTNRAWLSVRSMRRDPKLGNICLQ